MRLSFLAEKLIHEGKTLEADEKLQLAKKIEPDNSTVWYYLRFYYDRISEADKAIKCYEKAIELNPRYFVAYRNIGHCYLIKRRNYYQAEDYYTKAIRINPKRYPQIHKNCGIAREKSGKTIEAIGDYEKYIKYCPRAHDIPKAKNKIRELRLRVRL